jgi:hypothetical protein
MSQTYTYGPGKPPLPETPDELRARIPGWGADLDPADRPAVPRLQPRAGLTGAHWEFPDQQPENQPRERSIEHAFLTPVFGTSCPPRGLSGRIRRYSYARYSEARVAHWLLLIAADRVDAVEGTLSSWLTRQPDNPILETGLRTELWHSGLASRRESGRVDAAHHLLDPVIVAAPWLLGVAAGATVVRRVRRGISGAGVVGR